MYRSSDLSIRGGIAELEHSCDQWKIGGADEVCAMISDLLRVEVMIASGVQNWLHPDEVAERARQEAARIARVEREGAQ